MKIGITNFKGKMGAAMINAAKKDDDIRISAGFSKKSPDNSGFKITYSIQELVENSDVIIDFSSPELTLLLTQENLIQLKSIPIVIGTTDLKKENHIQIKSLSKNVPILQDYNMSLGINLICSLLPKFINSLQGFDIDITDKHHKHKIDSPSGTAKKLIDITRSFGKKGIYNKPYPTKKRAENSIGINIIRSGNIFGQHEILFASENEAITINHTAFNRELFAEGAILAAKWLINKKSGLYSMKDVLNLG